MSNQHKPRPCPQCGGTNRFYYIPRPHNGKPPHWRCNRCPHAEWPNGKGQGAAAPPPPALTPQELAQAQQGYTAAATWCAIQLWGPEGAAALALLRDRGFSVDTLRDAQIGYHPNAIRSGGLGDALYRLDQDAYHGAIKGGLLGAQGQAKTLLKDAITLPYLAGGACAMLRGRRVTPKAGDPKYLAPKGVPLYAGGTPIFFLHDVLSEGSVILTEGELKALAAWQAWRAGKLSLPAVATPGIGYLPDELAAALAGKTVYLLFDAEARQDPFHLSPGEAYTIKHGERLTGLGVERRRSSLARQLDREQAKRGAKRDDIRIAELEAELKTVEADAQAAQALNISVKVIRLPRPADAGKIDLDDFLLKAGASTLQRLVDHAPSFEDWYDIHGPGPYRYDKGGIFSGAEQLANYQARIVEDIAQHDGMLETAAHRVALRTPSGIRRDVTIAGEKWSDNRDALREIRAAIGEGAAVDESEVLKAIKRLSRHGDDPARRTVYTCTGWQEIGGRWHYLAPDGAITGAGVVTHIKSEISEHAQGNHYALCQPGDAAAGAQAFLQLLRGAVCPQSEALLLAGHAALALVHRFLGDGSRPALWPYGQSGGLKTALVRTFLSLWGPRFTAERADGAPLPKWDSTYVSMELLAFTYRDALFCVDDYKQATAGKGTTARFLHAYSEGSSRGRGTKDRKQDRTYPARGLAIITGEDRPAGDTGQIGRIVTIAHPAGSINGVALQDVQRAGAAGHLAAFWRGFVQSLASTLNLGQQRAQEHLQKLLRADDEALDVHARTAGAFRQNRAAWLVLTRWMQQAGHITATEAQELDAAHLEARAAIVEEQRQLQEQENPGTIFLRMLAELIQSGDAVIEHTNSLDTAMELQRRRQGHVIGFWYQQQKRASGEYIAIYSDIAYTLVAQRRQLQRQPLEYTKDAIARQLQSAGHLQKSAKGRYDAQVRRSDTGDRVWVWLFAPAALGKGKEEDGDDDPDDPPAQTVTTVTKEDLENGDNDLALQREEIALSSLSSLSPTNTLRVEGSSTTSNYTNSMSKQNAGDSGDSGDNQGLAHQDVENLSSSKKDSLVTDHLSSGDNQFHVIPPRPRKPSPVAPLGGSARSTEQQIEDAMHLKLWPQAALAAGALRESDPAAFHAWMGKITAAEQEYQRRKEEAA